jgi:hypothetical protein
MLLVGTEMQELTLNQAERAWSEIAAMSAQVDELLGECALLTKKHFALISEAEGLLRKIEAATDRATAGTRSPTCSAGPRRPGRLPEA